MAESLVQSIKKAWYNESIMLIKYLESSENDDSLSAFTSQEEILMKNADWF